MAGRGRSLLRLTVTFGVLAVGAWVARWGLGAGRLPATAPLPAVAELAVALTVATGIALIVAVAFRGVEASLDRRGKQGAVRPLRRIEAGVAVVLVLLFVVVTYVDLTTTLVGLGLLGFGLTLALQRPILSLAGWGFLTFSRPFREGDRVEIHGIVGDVLEIGFFSTRMWELSNDGSPLQGSVNVGAGRATGRTVTISNAVFLEEPVANASGDLSYVFDEFVVTVAYEADRALAERLLHEIADEVLEPAVHARAAREYTRLTRGMAMEAHFPRQPVVLESLEADWVELRLRYLVPVRERSARRKALAEAWLEVAARHPEALPNVYPRTQVMRIGARGRGLEE